MKWNEIKSYGDFWILFKSIFEPIFTIKLLVGVLSAGASAYAITLILTNNLASYINSVDENVRQNDDNVQIDRRVAQENHSAVVVKLAEIHRDLIGTNDKIDSIDKRLISEEERNETEVRYRSFDLSNSSKVSILPPAQISNKALVRLISADSIQLSREIQENDPSAFIILINPK